MAQDRLEIIMWNVEHGAAIYVNTPNGRSILLDAGASSTFSPAYHLYKNHHTDHVDAFILSHADCDHIRDIEEVDIFLRPQIFYRNKTAPRDLIYPTYPPGSNPLMYFHEFDGRYCYPLPADSPNSIDVAQNWGGLRIVPFYNQYPTRRFNKLNDYSVATHLIYGNLDFLFPGDLEALGWEALMEDETFRRYATPSSTNPYEIRILVAAHHGRAAGVYEPFLALYQPHVTLISDKGASQYTDNTTYYYYSQGYPVYNRATGTHETRYTISTKINDYVGVSADASNVHVFI